MSSDSTDAGGMNPLQRLILGQMRRRGWSPHQVEERGVKHATLHRYMNPVELKQLPRRHVLESLASGLDLAFEVVQAAAVATLDWDPNAEQPSIEESEGRRTLRAVPDDRDPNPTIAAIMEDPLLLPEAKAHFLNQYQLLLRIEREEAPMLSHVAEGTRRNFDPELEKKIDKAARKAAAKNPPSGYRDGDK